MVVLVFATPTRPHISDNTTLPKFLSVTSEKHYIEPQTSSQVLQLQ